MVVLSQPLDHENLSRHFGACKPASDMATCIPVIDLKDPNAKTLIVEACKEFGFFRGINHGISMEFLCMLESEALKFFKLPLEEKLKSGPPNPFGYGSKTIGPNGDVGWIEYLLFSTNPELISRNEQAIIPGVSRTLRCLVREYASSVREMACEVLEMIADELKLGSKDALSRLIRDEKSDSCLRLNHYPSCPDDDHHQQLQAALSGLNVIGFGEHTDPQIISVGRCNNTSGLQICLRDGATWLSVPYDQTSFFFNVGDCLHVMTNGKFRSVKHRVLLTESLKSRVSMIYFGGPPLNEKIVPLVAVMEEDEESLYREFKWCEFKNSAYNTRLGDNRLRLFEKYVSDK